MKAVIVAIGLGVISLFTEVLDKLVLFINYILTNFEEAKMFLFAVFGGLIDYFATISQSKEKFSFFKSLMNASIAGFTGLLVIKLCAYFKIDSDLAGFLIGISGYSGVRALRFFERNTQKMVLKLAQLKFELKDVPTNAEVNVTENVRKEGSQKIQSINVEIKQESEVYDSNQKKSNNVDGSISSD